MSKIVAIGASVTVAALIGGTLVITQMRTPTMANCSASAVGGATIGGPFELVDETGRTVTDADVITKPSLIYFGFTFCPDVCPLDLARNAAAVDILADRGIDVTPVFITIDPARDTPEIVGDYTDNFHPDMIGLTGTDAQIAAASKAYRTFYSKADGDPEYYLMQHSTFTYLTFPDKGFVEFFRQIDRPEKVADAVECFAAAT
ncbi:MAG: protein SCO1/2 [Yoonia sp.]|jgi:protein SCO1/2